MGSLTLAELLVIHVLADEDLIYSDFGDGCDSPFSVLPLVMGKLEATAEASYSIPLSIQSSGSHSSWFNLCLPRWYTLEPYLVCLKVCFVYCRDILSR